jgi:uncharacterized membrane protein YbhN (UPF0104 family)
MTIHLPQTDQPTVEPGHAARARRLQAAAAGAVIVAIFLQRRSLLAAVGRFGRVAPAWLAVALAAELVSYLAAAELERRLLAAGGIRLRLRSLLGLVWASGAVGASFPAGAAVSAAYSYRYLTRRGATGALAGWVLVATGILSGSALAALTLLGLELKGVAGHSALLATALSLSALAAAGSGVVIVTLLTARPDRVQAVVTRLDQAGQAFMRRIGRPTASRRDQTGGNLPGPVALGRGRWASCLSLAAINWLADGGALAFSLLAVGVAVPLRALVLAYSVSQLVTMVPLLPGAIGLAEGSMVLALVCAGVKPGDALIATLTYRLITFWLQLPAGWLAWASLRRAHERSVHPPAGLLAQ